MNKFLSIGLLLVSLQCIGQAWVKKKGSYYAKLGVNQIRSNRIFGRTGAVEDTVYNPLNNTRLAVPHINEMMIQFYGLYGVTDKLTGIASIPFKSVRNLENGQHVYGLADLELGLAYGWLTGDWKLTPSFTVGIPSGFYNSIDYTSTEFDINDVLITGDGEWNFMPRMYFGKSMNGKPIYVTGFLGYNWRTKGRYHEIDGLLEGGYTIGKLIVILKMQWKESLHNDPNVINYTGIYDNGQEFLSPNFGLYYKATDQWHFSFNVGGAITTKNSQKAPSFNFGVAYER